VADVVRAVGARRTARVRVPVEHVERAAALLSDVDSVDEATGELRFSAADGTDGALRALLDRGVPVLSYDVEGARLSEAFLEVTV